MPEMGCSLEVTGSEQRAGWSTGVDDCGNRALSANDDTSEMIWGTDIKRVRVQRALRNGEGGEGIAPLGIVRIERERASEEGEKRKRCFCANGPTMGKGNAQRYLLMDAKKDHN